jgi:hypothetical protein
MKNEKKGNIVTDVVWDGKFLDSQPASPNSCVLHSSRKALTAIAKQNQLKQIYCKRMRATVLELDEMNDIKVLIFLNEKNSLRRIVVSLSVSSDWAYHL